jgi:signal transduction histidine kinase
MLRMAMWRLDGWIAPHLAREDSRPYAHYSSIHAPVPAMTRTGDPFPLGSVRLPSPLLDAQLPDWMLLHFQYTPEHSAATCWQSPQVLPDRLATRLRNRPFELPLVNVTPERCNLLSQIANEFSPSLLLATVKDYSVLSAPGDMAMESRNPDQQYLIQNPPWNVYGNSAQQLAQPANSGGRQPSFPSQQMENDFDSRLSTLQKSRQPTRGGSERDPNADLDSITSPKEVPGIPQSVELGGLVPIWFPYATQPDHLLFARYARLGSKDVVQGVFVDWDRLQRELKELVAELFPNAKFRPASDVKPEKPEQLMSMLPVEMEPGPIPPTPRRGWTPLRIGLGVAWIAVAIALIAVAIGGWSLIDMSERRIRFVSAVTHELRTPMTTLRLYLDMLTSGFVTDDARKEEYLKTLAGESDRLNRLISNVLDYARLEKQGARAAPTQTAVSDLLESVRATWDERCQAAGKELVVEDSMAASTNFSTDVGLVQQILGNLIDNACKYSNAAKDRRIWLRTRGTEAGSIVFEVEDCGPGVRTGEKKAIFRPFQRGATAEVTAGGVGLGLALAQRWAKMLGGKLAYRQGDHSKGACFFLEIGRTIPS